ncbi:MAG: response regulator [Deltaproteobacteria bacterium]|nr:response regulator [Deltaproteobacteria bacterium]
MANEGKTTVRSRMCRLLREQRDALLAGYVRLLKEDAGPHYGTRPVDELEDTCSRSIDAYLAILCGDEWAAMERFIEEIAEKRFPLRFPLSEVQKAFAGFRELGVPALTASFRAEELNEAYGLLNRAVDRTVNTFSDRYQQLHLEEIRKTGEELECAHERLRSQYEEVAEAARIKARFFANMSHELRSPMNSIIGYAELLLDGLDGPLNDEQRGSLAKILASSRHLLKLINDVLDLSKLEAGRMELQVEPFSVRALVREAVDTVQPLAYRKHLGLRGDVEEGLEHFLGDGEKIKLVLINLLSNAVKFTEAGGVACSARRVAEGLQLDVEDTGVGIEQDDRERIFHKFFQVDGAQARELRGTGLGLPLSRMLVELMGGTVALESEKGRGSRFRVTIPERSTSDREAARGPRLKVLLIEDDPSALELMKRMAEADGMDTVTASGGEQGLDLARRERPAVITLDVLMPRVDGWAVLRDLKEDPELRAIPVVVVSCLDRREEALHRGASAYLAKPVERDRLVKTLRELAPRGSEPAR